MNVGADPIVIELIRRRIVRGLTQQCVARNLGVTQPTVARWESGERQIALDYLYGYAELVDCDVALIPREVPA